MTTTAATYPNAATAGAGAAAAAPAAAPSFQLASDLHIEFFRQEENVDFGALLTPSADVLLLAGDIGDPFRWQYAAFLAWCSERFELVCVCTGNHEYYGHEIEATDAAIRDGVAQLNAKAGSRNNVRFMQCDSLVYRRVRVLGCTLWSHVPPAAAEAVTNYLNDYRLIGGFTTDVNNAIHARHKRWLTAELAKTPQHSAAGATTPPAAAAAVFDATLVMTHHVPLHAGCAQDFYVNSAEHAKTNTAFATLLPELVVQADDWVAGHTHYCNQFVFDGACRVSLNCRGYPHTPSKWYKPSFSMQVVARPTPPQHQQPAATSGVLGTLMRGVHTVLGGLSGQQESSAAATATATATSQCVEVILVLGNANSDVCKRRVEVAVAEYRRAERADVNGAVIDRVLLFSCGTKHENESSEAAAAGEVRREAEWMQQYAVESLGVGAAACLLETQSANTIENIENGRQLARARLLEDASTPYTEMDVVLVTSSFHMRRCVAVCRFLLAGCADIQRVRYVHTREPISAEEDRREAYLLVSALNYMCNSRYGLNLDYLTAQRDQLTDL